MIKIVSLAIIFAIIIIYLKSINSELSLLALVGAGIIILFYSLEYISKTYEFFEAIINYTKLDNELFVILYKIIAIGYLTEFGAGTVKDFGLTSLADKLVFVGKIIILSISLPIIYAVFNLLIGISL